MHGAKRRQTGIYGVVYVDSQGIQTVLPKNDQEHTPASGIRSQVRWICAELLYMALW